MVKLIDLARNFGLLKLLDANIVEKLIVDKQKLLRANIQIKMEIVKNI